MRAPRNGPPFADLPGTDSDRSAIHGAGTVTANASTGLLWTLTVYLGRWHEYRPVRPADSVDGHGRTDRFFAQHATID
ncbi:hypothetical protein D3C71_1886900 [compost metagenome]